jgi:hypothetical protein
VVPAKPAPRSRFGAAGWTRGIAVDNRLVEVLVMPCPPPFCKGGKGCGGLGQGVSQNVFGIGFHDATVSASLPSPHLAIRSLNQIDDG